MKKNRSNFILAGVLLIGLSLLLYPTVSDGWNSFRQTRAIANYIETVAKIDDHRYNEIWTDARHYNETLLATPNPYTMSDGQRDRYNSLLNVSGNGMMGYIEIPSLPCSLPIYHGLDEATLQTAVGHLAGSSLPVGGAGTHCVISGHRGLPSAKLFTDLDKLTEGDTFMLRVLDETLTYEVDQILTVLPDEMDALALVPGKDLCTLVTCTPYGVNSHRLLVRGHRVENARADASDHVTTDAMLVDPLLIAPVIAAPVLVALFVVLLVRTGKKKKT